VTVVDLSNTTVEQCLNDAGDLSADRYLILEKAKSIWDEHDTKALMKKVKDVKAKMEFKQTKKGKGRMTGDLSDMESFCSTSQKIFDEFGKLGRFFKSYNDNFLNCKTPQTAASVVSCAPMVGTSFAVLVPILETINASGKVRAGIPQHLERVVKTLQALHAMAIFGKKYDLKTEDYETYCSYMVLLGKLIYKLGEMDDQRNGSWKRTKRLWLANEDTTELIELKEELDATELETAALKSLENNVIFNKLLEIVEALNVASPKK
jgi:hypothetical protein